MADKKAEKLNEKMGDKIKEKMDGTKSANKECIPPGNADKGKKLFLQHCCQCHSIQSGGKNKVGPNLFNILGQKCGKVKGFKYSDAFKKSDIVWTEDALFKYMANPATFIPGTKMLCAGLKKSQDRADVMTYMKSFIPKKK